MNQVIRFAIASLMLIVASAPLQASEPGLSEMESLNGFDLRNISVEQVDIFEGGPPRDGIPALDAPKFVAPADAAFLSPEDKILGVVIGDTARAYPVRILNWHEVVNDKIDDTAFSVTYCPLCGSGMVFAAETKGLALTFGVSGLIYDNNVLLYDRNTESLWSQIMGEAISGELQGERLTLMPVIHTTWADWLARHPQSEVLSTDTGHLRDYGSDPYDFYQQVGMIHFPRRHISPNTYKAHEPILGLTLNGVSKAYPYQELSKQGEKSFADNIGGEAVTIHWNQEAASAYATDSDGNTLAETYSYWFAWYSFNPQTDVFVSTK
ncbi:MAG: hypothetical protein AseanaTS_03120 [Candidatus Pelagadaptatus aseana]|uniref:DUF3179 domain-containing protein n=1 Tax=Candidatus Pelagadaptatus aseana TaxID=3120508 RepID=UPI0039B18AE7